MNKEMSHYEYLDKYWFQFAKNCGANLAWADGIVTCHGDKGYYYEDLFDKNGISFNNGMMIFLLSYVAPFSEEVERSNPKEFQQWLVNTYNKFKHLLPENNSIS